MNKQKDDSKKILIELEIDTIYYAKIKARVIKKALSKYINDLIKRDTTLLRASLKREIQNVNSM